MLLYDSTIYSLNETHNAVMDVLSSLAETICLDEELEFKIKIIINELVTNYFIHEEKNSYVRLLAKPKGEFISIVLMEDSLGFDVFAALHCRSISEEKPVLCESGRGLHIVSLLADALRYNRKGNIIAIHVNLV